MTSLQKTKIFCLYLLKTTSNMANMGLANMGLTPLVTLHVTPHIAQTSWVFMDFITHNTRNVESGL